MSRSKDGIRPIGPWMVTCVALCLCGGGSGCTAMSGLRSIGLEHPRLLGFWDRSQTSPPGLGDDYYAQSMHAGEDRSGAGVKRSEEVRKPSGGESEPDGDATAGAAQPVRDETVGVTLGRPEPLPALAAPVTPETDLAASRSMSPGKLAQGAGAGASSPAAGPVRPAGGRRTTDQTRRAAGRGQPGPPTSPDGRTILAQSEAQLRALDTYQVQMSRRERVGGQLQPEEEVILSIRREPKAVRLEWAKGPNQGREVIYSTRLDERSLFVHMPSTAIPLPTMKIPVDSPMVMKNSRHSITEAGFDTILANLRKALDQQPSSSTERGGSVYQGLEQPPGLDRPSHRFTRRSPSGETWTVYLDARSLLPCLVLAHDAAGQLEERYLYHEVRQNPTELASADAFDPTRRWGEPKSFLTRFARAAAGGKDSDTRHESAR
ncbi:MAG TPA: DUF1571 domain-containing protein [Isosphaeraceae bacterium]|nr:DUF1571 domain-containing protein [Isosphaeraceae bacterium]